MPLTSTSYMNPTFLPDLPGKQTNKNEKHKRGMDFNNGSGVFVLFCFSFLAYCLSGLHVNLLVYSQMYANLVI